MNHGTAFLVVCLSCLISSTHNQLSLKQQEELIRALSSGRFGPFKDTLIGRGITAEVQPNGPANPDPAGAAEVQPAAVPNSVREVRNPQQNGGLQQQQQQQGRNLAVQFGPPQAALPAQEQLPGNPAPGNLNVNDPQPSLAEGQKTAEVGNRLNEPTLAQEAELLRQLEAFAEAQQGSGQQQPQLADIQKQIFQNPDASLKTLQQFIDQSGGNTGNQQNNQDFANAQQQEQLRRFQQLSQSFPPDPIQQNVGQVGNPLDSLRAAANLQNAGLPNNFQLGQNGGGQQAGFNNQFGNPNQLNQQQIEQLLRQFQGNLGVANFANGQLNQNQFERPARVEVPSPVVPTPPQVFNMPSGRSLQPPKPEKPFFTVKCKDCNIALGDKEILNFLGDLVEHQQQQQQELPPAKRNMLEKLANSFDMTCDNCNVLVGGKEALVAAAENMFQGNVNRSARKPPSAQQP